jgi:monoamine oxidase
MTMITRRRFLQSTGVALTGLSTGSLHGAEETADVVIIGAGLAGLTAAITLMDEGAKVVVLEANSWVGGRTHTLETSLTKLNPGATTVGPLYARVRNMMSRFEVGLRPLPARWGTMGAAVGGELVRSDQWAQAEVNRTRGGERVIKPWVLENRLLSADNPLENPFAWLEPSADYLDISLRQLLQSRGVSEEAQRLIDITINANDLDQASALMYLRDLQRLGWAEPASQRRKGATYTPSGDGSFVNIAGGTGALPAAMAEFLGDQVRLNQVVTSVAQEVGGVAVRCSDGSRYRADQVVCAAPLAVVKNIHWQPALTGSLAELTYASQATGTTHIYFAVEKPFWEDDIGDPSLFTDTMLERIFAGTDRTTGEVTYLDCWINGRGARQIDAIPLEQLGEFATATLIGLRPSTKGKVRFLTSYSWGRNPYVRGNKHEWRPGEMPLVRAAINQDTAPIYFAGEHFRIGEPGMEGAAESGERAALRILGGV